MLAVAFALAMLTGPISIARAGSDRWVPTGGDTWQIQFSGRTDLSVAAGVFDIDAFDTSRRSVKRLHTRGRRAVCYVNAGAWEDWAP